MSFSPLRYLKQLGPLRLLLVVVGLATLVARPPAGTPTSLEGWDFIYTVVIPVVAPIVFVLLLLDALMSRVFMTASETADLRQRMRTILITNLLVAGVMLIAWAPFMLALRQP